MLEKGKVWFAPMEDIVRHVQTCIADGSYTPRIDTLPYYDAPVFTMPLAGGASGRAAE